MRTRDVVAALVVMTIWGVNFTAIGEGLKGLPPLLFVAFRFALTAFPAVLVVRRPDVGWRTVVALGLLMCVGQFGLLFLGMSEGMPAGLSSVVMQSQVVFTAVIAAVALGERASPRQVVGMAIAVGGLAMIGLHRGIGVPIVALVCLLGGAACWGAANVVTRAARPERPLSLLVYSSAVAPVPLIAWSLATEGVHRDAAALGSLDATVVGSLLYVVVLGTFVGFGTWYRLLGRYVSSSVAPFTLLVPVTGLTSAWIALGERPTALQLWGSLVAIVGVGVVVTRRPRTAESAQYPAGSADLPAGATRAAS
jgi:O-acetylserine/cysteine efflux transporter